jgi:hypothetical protein
LLSSSSGDGFSIPERATIEHNMMKRLLMMMMMVMMMMTTTAL